MRSTSRVPTTTHGSIETAARNASAAVPDAAPTSDRAVGSLIAADDLAARAACRCAEAMDRGEPIVLIPDTGPEARGHYDRLYAGCVDPILEHQARQARQRLAPEGSSTSHSSQQAPSPGPRPARPSGRDRAAAPHDRDLVTVAEFAAALSVAQSTVFEWLLRGLPSVKTNGLGRRIRRQQAEAWLLGGGPETSRAARKLAKARAADGGSASGDPARGPGDPHLNGARAGAGRRG